MAMKLVQGVEPDITKIVFTDQTGNGERDRKSMNNWESEATEKSPFYLPICYPLLYKQ